MQRQAVAVFALIAGLIAGCGSSSKSKTPTAASLTISPSNPSLDVGRFTALKATIVDSSGAPITSLTPTWSSSKPNVVDVSTNGAICAGKWDSTTTPTICTPGPVDSAVITATAGGVSGSVTVTTHVHIARLVLTTLPTGCTSQNQQQQFSFTAFDSSNVDISASVGPPTLSISDLTIGSIDSNAIVTAKRPGQAQVNASISGTNALPATFTVCPPASISIGLSGSPNVTDFTLASPQTATLAATVIDIKGNPITDLGLTFTSSAPGVASVAPSALTATVTANVVGRAGIVASCTPPTCNPGVNKPIYSNVATFTVTGSPSPKVIAASANSSSIAIIDSTNTVSATVSLPSVNVNGTATIPQLNSVVISGDGSRAFFGSNVGVLTMDLNTNTFSTTTFLFAGKVFAASTDGTKVLVSDGGSFTVIDTTTGGNSGVFPILNAVAADLSLDSIKVFAVSGGTLNAVNRAAPAVTPIPLAATGSDVKFLKQGTIAFVAEPGASTQIFATCDNSPLGSVAATPQLLASSNDSARMFGANTTTVFSITPTITPIATPTPGPTDCAPTASTSVTSAALGATITPRQVIAAPNASRAVVLGDTTSVFSYADGGAVTVIPLSGGGTSTTGGITSDSATLYVGTTNGDVQRIDLGGGVVLQSIPAGLKDGAGTATFPDIVAVRPK
jgi:hypothetical protein